MLLDWLPVCGLIPWILLYAYIGFPNIYELLGGSFGFFALYPIIVYMHLKFRKYRKLIWLFTSTIAGLIVLDGICSYVINLNEFAYVVLISFPISWVIYGYAAGIEGYVKREARNNEIYKNFILFYLIVLLIPFDIMILLISMNIIHKKGLIFILLGSIITSGLIMLITTQKITIEEIVFFSKPIERINISVKKAKKYLVLFIIAVIVFSSYWEVYRKEWLLWIETVFVFIIQISL